MRQDTRLYTHFYMFLRVGVCVGGWSSLVPRLISSVYEKEPGYEARVRGGGV